MVFCSYLNLVLMIFLSFKKTIDYLKKQSNNKLVYVIYWKTKVLLTIESSSVFQANFDFVSSNILYFGKRELFIVYSGKHVTLKRRSLH